MIQIFLMILVFSPLYSDCLLNVLPFHYAGKCFANPRF